MCICMHMLQVAAQPSLSRHSRSMHACALHAYALGGGSASSLKTLKVLKLAKIGRASQAQEGRATCTHAHAHIRARVRACMYAHTGVFKLKKAALVLEDLVPARVPSGLFGLLGVVIGQVGG